MWQMTNISKLKFEWPWPFAEMINWNAEDILRAYGAPAPSKVISAYIERRVLRLTWRVTPTTPHREMPRSPALRARARRSRGKVGYLSPPFSAAAFTLSWRHNALKPRIISMNVKCIAKRTGKYHLTVPCMDKTCLTLCLCTEKRRIQVLTKLILFESQ